jgi:polysaccharide export outer membrane protein
MKRNILFAFALLTLLSQFAFGQTFTDVKTENQAYLLGPGDKIQVKVLGEQQFDFQTEIGQTGAFRVPFVEEVPVMAKCRTENEIRKDVEDRFSKYLKDPTVSLVVSERRKPIPVTIYGEVNNQQPVALTRDTTLMELLAFSGGVNQEYAGGTVQVKRNLIWFVMKN